MQELEAYRAAVWSVVAARKRLEIADREQQHAYTAHQEAEAVSQKAAEALGAAIYAQAQAQAQPAPSLAQGATPTGAGR